MICFGLEQWFSKGSMSYLGSGYFGLVKIDLREQGSGTPLQYPPSSRSRLLCVSTSRVDQFSLEKSFDSPKVMP